MLKGTLIAPNGKPSNLTAEQYKLVRTPEFKAWFGDWENLIITKINDSEIDEVSLKRLQDGVSKVVDENGEPLVVYHGTNFEFFIFGEGKNKNILDEYQEDYAFQKKVNYFHKSKEYSETFGSKYGGYEKSFFLDIKKIALVDEDTIEDIGYWKNIYEYNVIIKQLDGIYSKSGQYATLLNPHQIKLADGTNTTFDGNNPDIRFDEGGKVEDLISQGVVELKMFDTNPEHAKEYGLDSVNPLYVQSLCITENQRLKGIGNKVLQYIDDYAIKNGHDLVFGHITQKAEFTKNSRPSDLCDIDLIKEFLIKGGYSTIKGNNDFYKVIKTNPDIRFDEGGMTNKGYVSYKDKYNTKYGYKNGESHDLEEISKDTGVSIKGLQQIYNKGIGAYKTNPQSVRPNVKSKEQWAMARVYSAVMGGKASKVDSNELNEGKMEKGGTNTTFDGDNADIRFDEGGNVIINSTEIECHSCNWKWKVKDGGDDLFICHKCNYDNLKYYMLKEEKSKRGNMSYKQGGVIYQDLSLIPPTVLMESETAYTTEIDEVSIVKTGKTFVFNERKITSAQQAFDLLKDFWRLENIDVVEEMNVIYLNKENRPISIYQHSKGGIDSTIADIEVISAIALKTLAKGVIIAHNHPSGNLNPSPADKEISQQLKNGLKLFGIILLDSMIVTKNGYYSMADQGTLKYGGEINDKSSNFNCDCPKCMSNKKTLILDEADTRDTGKMFLVKLEDFFYVIYDDEIVSKSNNLKDAKKDFELELYKDKINTKKKFVKGGAITDNELEQIEKIVPKNMMLSIKENLIERKKAQENGDDVENFDYFENLIKGYREIPKLYYQDEKGKNAIVYLHYFRGGSDWYITELDKETNEAFGYVILNGDIQNSEFGYMNLNEFANSIIEIDLYWSFKTLNEIFENQFPELVVGEIEYFNKDATLTRLTDFEVLIEKNAFKNQYEVNQFIELMIDEKGMDNNLYTTIEQSFLQRYSGMGGLQKYGATGKGILWEYYTPKNFADIMWQLAYKYKSVSKFDRVLENSVGIGVFVNSCPLQVGSMDCYDISKYAIAICQILYGKDKRFTFFNKSFETKFFNGNTSVKANVEPIYDLVIGNPPYSPYSGKYAGMGEKKYTKAENYIDYFIFRSLDLLKSGGLLVYILGSVKRMGQDNWLESKDNYTKNEIKKKADLVDALRLGSGVFEFTDVDSDIIVLRKK